MRREQRYIQSLLNDYSASALYDSANRNKSKSEKKKHKKKNKNDSFRITLFNGK